MNRSAISGRFVTAKHGKRHPKTTLREDPGGHPTGRSRSAITGRFVTTSYAKRNPKVTVTER